MGIPEVKRMGRPKRNISKKKAEKFSEFDKNSKPVDPKSSTNTKKDKHKENLIEANRNQIAKNQG